MFSQGSQVILESVVDVTVHGSQCRKVIFTDGSRQEPGEEDLEESGEGTSQESFKFFIGNFLLALGDVLVKTVGSVVDETDIRPLGVVDDGVGSRTMPDDDLEALRKEILGSDGGGEALHVGLGGVGHFFSPTLNALVGLDIFVGLVVIVDDVGGVVSDAVPKSETVISVEVAGEAIGCFSGETSGGQLAGETGSEEIEFVPQSGGNDNTVLGTNDEGLVGEGKDGIDEGVSGEEVDTDGFVKMGLEEASEGVGLGELIVGSNTDGFNGQMGETQMVAELVGVVISAGDEHLDGSPEVGGGVLGLVDGGIESSFELDTDDGESVLAVGEVFSEEQQVRSVEELILVGVLDGEVVEEGVVDDEESLLFKEFLDGDFLAVVGDGEALHGEGNLLQVSDPFDHEGVDTLQQLLAKFFVSSDVLGEVTSQHLVLLGTVGLGEILNRLDIVDLADFSTVFSGFNQRSNLTICHFE